MDTLKGKQIMVWTFMGNARMYEALRDYGDRISQIGLFSFKVRATGEIYESGVAISDMLTYINKWPHIKWLLTVANDGANSIFRALRDNTNGAQEMFLSEIVRIMEKYPCGCIPAPPIPCALRQRSAALQEAMPDTARTIRPCASFCVWGMPGHMSRMSGLMWRCRTAALKATEGSAVPTAPGMRSSRCSR